MNWQCSTFSFDTRVPTVMGILNLTPDSFSDGGQFSSTDEAIAYARGLVNQGAHIIDVGGESTRPGASEVSVEEELDRVLEVVRALASEDICVSIDTRHAAVARACVEAGASIINDVSGFRDSAMVQVAQDCDAGLVVMHMRGEPATMQDDTEYTDVVVEVADYLRNQARMLEKAGIGRQRICVDPGPGFGKTASQTYELLLNMHELVKLGYPLMVALSRKKFLESIHGVSSLRDRDRVSAEEAARAVELGASIVRAHNVAALMQELSSLRPYVYIGLGANVALVGEPGEEREAKIAQLEQAIGQLCMLPDSQLLDVASYYESEPAYESEEIDQEPYVNTVVKLRTNLDPHELLKHLHMIEDSLGRVRTTPNGSRTCDLDLLDYQGKIMNEDDLTLPHPRLCERDFVVKPLLELAPGHVLSNNVLVTYADATKGTAERIDRMS